MALTQVNLANIVTGVLPVANGGTGTSTGVSPGGSTTQVQYNNAGAFAGSANFVFDGTNVGIGNTPSGWATYKVAQIGSGTADASIASNNDDTNISTNAYYNAGWKYQSSSTLAERYQQGAGTHRWYYAPSGTAGNAITWSEAMRLDSSGNLGIGTTSPSCKLEIGGTNPEIRLGPVQTTSGAYMSYNTSGNYFSLNAVTQGVGYRNLCFATDGGSVGIGTTSPSYKLTIAGASVGRGFALSDSTSGSISGQVNNNTNQFNFGVNNAAGNGMNGGGAYGVSLESNGAYPMAFVTNATERMRIDSSGNVFVGGTTQNTSTKPVYASNSAKAWVNFDGSGTIRASYNVSSVTKNGTGNYTINFANALADANYTFGFGLWRNQDTGASRVGVAGGYTNTTYSSTQLQILTRWVDGGGESYEDPLYASITVFR